MSVHTPAWNARLTCTKCRAGLGDCLRRAGSQAPVQEVRCGCCGAIYKVEDGILNFHVRDAFYDEHGFTTTGRDFRNNIFGRLGLYYARHHYLYEIHRTVASGSAVIEIGCGGGSRYLASRYDMLGIEVSASSVRQARHTYPSVVQATIAELPCASLCADAIVSSCVLEHLDDHIIRRCFAEMARVLRPGGVMVHFLDLDGEDSFFRWAKRQEWFEGIFVTSKGHLGLRPLGEWQTLFEAAGFRIERRRLFCKTWLQDLSIWAALDDPRVRGFPRYLGSAASGIRRAVGQTSDVVVTMIHDCVDRWLPDRWAAKAILQLRKVS